MYATAISLWCGFATANFLHAWFYGDWHHAMERTYSQGFILGVFVLLMAVQQ